MIIIGLGSNLGNPEKNIRKALLLLVSRGVRVVNHSSLFRTPPWGKLDQDDFLNAVVIIQTEYTPVDLLKNLLEVEDHLGRERAEKWGPRLIDLDLIEYENLKLQTENLILPHPFYLERNFVIGPLAEVLPEFIPTGEQKSIHQIWTERDQKEISVHRDRSWWNELHENGHSGLDS